MNASAGSAGSLAITRIREIDGTKPAGFGFLALRSKTKGWAERRQAPVQQRQGRGGQRLRSGRGSWVAWVCLVASVAACGGRGSGSTKTASNTSYKANAQAAYKDALAQKRKGKCSDAAPAFQSVRSRFPYSRYAALAELRIGECHIDQKENTEAAQVFQRFIRTHPSHPQVPYATFRVADAYFREVPSGWWLAPPDHEIDQAPTRSALENIRVYLRRYPEGRFVLKLRDMEQKCVDLLAHHEWYAAKYYLKRDKPKGAILRLERLLDAFPKTTLAPEAKKQLAKLYAQTGNTSKLRALQAAEASKKSTSNTQASKTQAPETQAPKTVATEGSTPAARTGTRPPSAPEGAPETGTLETGAPGGAPEAREESLEGAENPELPPPSVPSESSEPDGEDANLETSTEKTSKQP